MIISNIIKQKAYEKVEYLLRRHPITFFPMLLLFLALIAVPHVLYFLINSMFLAILNGPIFYPIAVLVTSIYYLSLYIFFYAQFIDFYLDLWIITNDRVVDIEQMGLFSRTISELDLFRVQDVTVEIHGFFSTLFHYGNITVKTASSGSHFVFHHIHNPNEIRQALIRLAEADRKHHQG